MTMNAWRNDFLNYADDPTAFSHVVRAEDEIPRTSHNFKLIIAHVQTMRGNGFMPSVRGIGGGSMHNGGVTLGGTKEAYEKALEEGKKLLQSEEDRLSALLLGIREH